MSCEFGQTIQNTFDRAVSARIDIEAKHAKAELKEAKAIEATAIRARAFHLHDCSECWQRPPRKILAVHWNF